MTIEAAAINCPRCGRAGELVTVGTASGRGHYRCSDRDCNNQWREKNPAIVAAARLGGLARAAALTPERREEIALIAGNANRRRLIQRKLAR